MKVKSNEVLFKNIGRKKWKVIKSFSVQVRGHLLIIPKGFIFDGYTLAPELSSLIPAAVHDWLYIHKQNAGNKYTKLEADKIFKELIKRICKTKILHHVYYIGVRMNFCKALSW